MAEAIGYATLDLSGSYRAVFDTMLPDAVQVADPFHLVKLADLALDGCRRRVQDDTLDHRGRKTDPLLSVPAPAHQGRRASRRRRAHQAPPVAAGRRSPVATAWHAKEAVRMLYFHTDPALALEWVTRLGHDSKTPTAPEVRRLGRTLLRWPAIRSPPGTRPR